MNLIEGMVFGENPREGFVKNEAFVHPDLEFRFPVPGGWQVINQPTQVAMVSPSEDAVMIMRIDSESTSAAASVRSFMGQEGITLVDEGQAMSSGEWTAYEAEATATSNGNELGLYVYAVEFQDNIYRFINYSAMSAFDNYLKTFQRTTGQFDRLTDQSILNINPVRLKVVEADRRAQFREFLPDPIPMDHQPLDLAILNQVNLDEMIEPGQKLKIPVQ